MNYKTILEEIKMLSLEERLTLLESITTMLRTELTPPAPSTTPLTASEIRRLPLPQRQQILAEAAQLALADYQPGSELIEITEALAGDGIDEYEEG